MVGNVLGSDAKLGKLDNGTQIIEYFPPNSPIPALNFHYSYVVFEQNNGVEGFSALKELGNTAFPVE